ncbi:MAG TPA: hypothetical protein VH701_23875 [Vicinamibacterales bacterium]|jgi:hypothetical protein
MRTVIRPCILVIAFALLPVSARAQTGPAQVEWFAAGSLAMISSSSGEAFRDNPSILRPGIGGSALAAVVVAGAFVTPHLGFAGEVTLPGEFHVQQTWGRDATTWDSDHRDRSLVGLVLVRTGEQRVQLIGAFGAGNVWSHTETTQRSRPFGRPPTDPPQFTFTSTHAITDLTLVAGAEVNTRLSAHVSLVPAFRLLFVPREEDNPFNDQLATYLFHIGIGVRVWF